MKTRLPHGSDHNNKRPMFLQALTSDIRRFAIDNDLCERKERCIDTERSCFACEHYTGTERERYLEFTNKSSAPSI